MDVNGKEKTARAGGRAGRKVQRQRVPAGTFAAAFCAAVGCGGLAFALGLVIAPSIWPEAARLAPKLAAQGVTPALAGATATVWLGLALAIITERRAAVRFTGEGERLTHRVDRVIAEQTFVRTGLMEQRAETLSLRQDVAAISSLIQNEIARAQEARAAQANKEDGLFRVAASLDQLHAKLEQRLPHSAEEQRSGQRELERSLLETLTRVETVLGELAETPGTPRSSEPEPDAPLRATTTEDANSTTQGTGAPAAAEGDEFARACTPREEHPPTTGALEEADGVGQPASVTAPLPGEREPASIPLETAPSLGLLDAFDDFGEFDASRTDAAGSSAVSGGPLQDSKSQPDANQPPAGPRIRLSPRVEFP